MPAHAPDFVTPPVNHLGGRQHRFMESADINAAFREVFSPLRTNIRRGMGIAGEIYAIEVDACIPGELLGATWIPLASYGIADAELLHDAERRRALFERMLAEQRPEALFIYVRERRTATGRALLCVEIVSADGYHAAEYRIRPGTGWHVRELLEAPHRRLGSPARACAAPGRAEPR